MSRHSSSSSHHEILHLPLSEGCRPQLHWGDAPLELSKLRQGAGVGDEVTEFPLPDPVPPTSVCVRKAFFPHNLTHMYKWTCIFITLPLNVTTACFKQNRREMNKKTETVYKNFQQQYMSVFYLQHPCLPTPLSTNNSLGTADRPVTTVELVDTTIIHR